MDWVGSLVNPSCNPNAVIVFETSILIVRAIRKFNVGEEIFRGYVEETRGITLIGAV